MLMTVTATASAVGGTVSNLTIQQDANIAIQPLTDAGTAITPTDGTYKEVSKFQITLNQTKQGGTYLLMVLSGDGLPTKDTLYWANILPGNGGKLDVKVNAKKPMGDGAYKVFLSSGETDATLLGSLDYETGAEFIVGDATLDGNVDIKDVNAVIGHITKNKLLTGNALQAANVVKDGTDEITVDIKDANKLIGYVTKNVKSLTD